MLSLVDQQTGKYVDRQAKPYNARYNGHAAGASGVHLLSRQRNLQADQSATQEMIDR